jgi:hypothetical protein
LAKPLLLTESVRAGVLARLMFRITDKIFMLVVIVGWRV